MVITYFDRILMRERAESVNEGKDRFLFNAVKRMTAKDTYSLEEIAELTDLTVENVKEFQMLNSMPRNSSSGDDDKYERAQTELERQCELRVNAEKDEGREAGERLAAYDMARKMLMKQKYSVQKISKITDFYYEHIQDLASYLTLEVFFD